MPDCFSALQKRSASAPPQIYFFRYAHLENRIYQADTAPTHSRHLQIPEGAGSLSLHRSVQQARQGASLQENISHSCCPDRRLFRASFRLSGNPVLFHFPKDIACRDGTVHTRTPAQRTAEAIAPLQLDRIEGCLCRGMLLPCGIETADGRDRSTIF